MTLPDLIRLLSASPEVTGSTLSADLDLITSLSPELARARVAEPPPGDLARFARAYDARPAPRVTAVVLARDEAATIGACLAALRPAVDQILLIDAGSHDETVNLALAAAPELAVVSEPWREDFAHQRNLAFDHVHTGWICFIDADEVLSSAMPEDAVRRTASVLDHLAPRLDLVVSPRITDTNGTVHADTRRMYRAATALRYRGRIHERPYDPGGMPPPALCAAVPLQHSGYQPDVIRAKDKHERNRHLLELALAEEPANPTWVYYLVRDSLVGTEVGLERATGLYERLQRSLKDYIPAAPAYYTQRRGQALALLCDLAGRLGRPADADHYRRDLQSAGHLVEAAHANALADAHTALGALSTVVDTLDEVTARSDIAATGLAGPIADLQGLLALACGRYQDVPRLLAAARSHGAGDAIGTQLESARQLIDSIAPAAAPRAQPLGHPGPPGAHLRGTHPRKGRRRP